MQPLPNAIEQVCITFSNFCCILFLSSLAWLIVAPAHAEQRSFYGSNGSFAGSSVTRGNSTSVYDKSGSFSGSAIRHGNSTSFYDGRGRFTGSSTGPRR